MKIKLNRMEVSDIIYSLVTAEAHKHTSESLQKSLKVLRNKIEGQVNKKWLKKIQKEGKK